MTRRITRRRFFKTAAAAAAAAITIVPSRVLGQVQTGQVPPSEKLYIAGIGVGGQGGGDIGEMSTHPHAQIVALCDIDWKKAAAQFKKFDKSGKFKDYRVLLDRFAKSFDAVMVATPDHMHAPISLAAMRAGKHVYVEKPMAHSIEEARLMTGVAKATGVVTQMGNNGHANDSLRETREWLDAGAIGKVKEIHCWTDRPGKPGHPWWPQPAKPVPNPTPPIPETLDWDLFLGCAPVRPYNPNIHPHDWRAYFDFGTGALGDMAIHNMDPAFYCLDLGAPTGAYAETTPLGPDSYPAQQTITYEFAARGDRPAVNLIWHDGGRMPPDLEDLKGQYTLPDNGILFVGEKGTMVCDGWAGKARLFPGERRKEFQPPPKTLPRSKGHRFEWIEAAIAGKPEQSMAGFWYSGPYTEALLVGNLAVRLQKRIDWDSQNMKATNAPEADPLIRKTYRQGFGIA
jgi:predicted dehydrogenase